MKLGYQYKYDASGNIKEVYSRTGTNALALESSYEYDKLGQITKAADSRGTETYTYDTAGNLLSRALGGTGSTYTYGNSSWGDLLTAFKGQGIAYEGQTYSAASNTVSGTAVSGNPVSYYNGTRWAMDWKNGTQLSTVSASGKNVSYTYDKDGLRTMVAFGFPMMIWMEVLGGLRNIPMAMENINMYTRMGIRGC